jgi:hypothetical protein
MRETALNKTVYSLLKKGRLNMPRWTPHDLRRTSRSCWSEQLGIPWDLCERLLGHVLPTVVRTYDTGSYLEQRRDALQKWAACLERIAGSGAPVVALPSGIGMRVAGSRLAALRTDAGDGNPIPDFRSAAVWTSPRGAVGRGRRWDVATSVSARVPGDIGSVGAVDRLSARIGTTAASFTACWHNFSVVAYR